MALGASGVRARAESCPVPEPGPEDAARGRPNPGAGVFRGPRRGTGGRAATSADVADTAA